MTETKFDQLIWEEQNCKSIQEETISRKLSEIKRAIDLAQCKTPSFVTGRGL